MWLDIFVDHLLPKRQAAACTYNEAKQMRLQMDGHLAASTAETNEQGNDLMGKVLETVSSCGICKNLVFSTIFLIVSLILQKGL